MVISVTSLARIRRQRMLSASASIMLVLTIINLTGSITTTMVVFGFTSTTTTLDQLSVLSSPRKGTLLGMTIEKEKASTSRPGPGPGRKRKKNVKNRNPAMGDTGFLRKRTSHMLRVTRREYQDSQDTSTSGRGGMKVDMKSFHFLIDAWAFSGEDDSSEQALALLGRMEELMDHQHPLYSRNIRPDVRSYTKVINAIARSSRGGPETAESLLDKMNDLYHHQGYVAAKPNTHTYTAVVEAHANSGAPGMAQRAEELCETMVQKHLDGDPDVQPTARAFNAAILACAKSGEPDAAQRAENLLGRMETLYESGISSVKPNSYNFNSLITAWANHCDSSSNNSNNYNNNYNNEQEVDFYDNYSFSEGDFATAAGESGGSELTTVPIGIGAVRAEEVLERMEYLYYIKHDKDSKPTTVSYNAVLDAYAKCGGDDAAVKAESLLRRMEELYRETGAAKPNVRSYNTLLNVWAKSGHEDAANKAQDVLDMMTELYEKGNKQVRPDVHSYCTVINAWARSRKQGKAERALNLFREMQKLYEDGKHPHLRPNVVAVNAVMNACAYTSGNRDGFDVLEQNRAVEIAHFILKVLEKNPDFGKPDQVSYGTFLQVCANQMPDTDTRQKVVEVLFKKCVKDGQVGNLVLNQLQTLASEELYYNLIGKEVSEPISMEDLPSEWWCHVVEGKWRRRRLQ